MKTAKKLFAALLAVMMVMALVIVPASAVGDDDTTTTGYSIKITSPDASNDHQFNAYQIFSGTLSSDGKTLTDVEWGSGIDQSKLADLYTALKNITVGGSKPFEAMTQDTAASVSDVLAENNTNTALVEAFQELITDKTGASYTYLSNTSTLIEHGTDDSAGIYTAANVAAGYYVVVDAANTNAAGLMLEVVGPVDVTAKLDVPSVKKYAGDVAVTDNANFSVGDQIPYTLEGTTPNFDADKSYSYQFTDIMDEALDLSYEPSTSNPNQVEGGVTVTIGAGENATDITDKFLITYVDHTLTIASKEDLKDSGLSADSTIYVTYKATVNSSVSHGTNVDNSVTVASQVDEDGTPTMTPEVKEQVYPITLEITKVDGATGALLPNAKFILSRKIDETTTEYATTNINGQFTGWTTDKEQAATLTTDSTGKFTLVGIGAGTFYLEETEAPEGYNTLDTAIQIEIVTTSETSSTGTVQLAELKYSLNGGATVNVTGENLTNGTVAFNVENNQGAQLPSTGGIGTTIFYVAGGVLIVGAVVLLVTRKRMNNAD